MLGVFFGVIGQMVNAAARVALFADGYHVGEFVGMAGCFPHQWVHQNRAVKADDIIPHLDDGLPPGVADIAFEFRAKGP